MKPDYNESYLQLVGMNGYIDTGPSPSWETRDYSAGEEFPNNS
jgi:hypothetical protein